MCYNIWDKTVKESQTTKSKIISLRLSEQLLKKLLVHSAHDGISLSSLIIKLLDKYLSFESDVNRDKIAIVSKPFLSEVLKMIPEKEIIKMAETKTLPFIFDGLEFRGASTIEGKFEFLLTYLKIAGFRFEYLLNNDSMKKFSIHHDMGKNYSLYLKTLTEKLGNKCDYKLSDCSMGEGTFSATLEKVTL